MKKFLFDGIVSVTGFAISVNLFLGNTIGSIIADFFNGLNFGFKFIAERLLSWIDSDRFKHVSLATSQRCELTELDLLMAANKVKEDAVTSKIWTTGHTIALNRIANELHTFCGWEPAKIHGYLRPLVESIPGVGYTSEEDSGDSIRV